MREAGEFIGYSRVLQMICAESCRKGEGVCKLRERFGQGIPSFEVEQASFEICSTRSYEEY